MCRGSQRGQCWEEECPPIPAVLLAEIQKGLFSASVRAAQLGREGGKEDRRASRRWGKARSRTRAVSTALETGQRTQPATSCGNPAGLAGEQSHHSVLLLRFPLLCGIWGISRAGSPHPLGPCLLTLELGHSPCDLGGFSPRRCQQPVDFLALSSPSLSWPDCGDGCTQ